MAEKIVVIGAREHNLKGVDVSIPRESLTVITGLSGSGKSSLAFDTIYAEGQRRYIDTFSAYARNFMGAVEKPDVEDITGLSPVISIEQKTTNKNPRSTVGTVTEIYDFLRLLYARAGEAYSYVTGEKMVRYKEEHISEMIQQKFLGRSISILSPLVYNRKGSYKELFNTLIKHGYSKVRVDGDVVDLKRNMLIDRYKNHSIEVVIDRVVVKASSEKRLYSSIKTAMKESEGVVMILDKESDEVSYFSRTFMCATTGISYRDPAPHTFSFNSPQGACSKCNGLGVYSTLDIDKLVPDRDKSIEDGAIEPLGRYKNIMPWWQIDALVESYGAKISTPIGELTEECIGAILYGSDKRLRLKNTPLGASSEYAAPFDGAIHYIDSTRSGAKGRLKRWKDEYTSSLVCPECSGKRLNVEALHFLIDGKNIVELASLSIAELSVWFSDVDDRLSDRQKQIASEIVKEIRSRLDFLMDVGLQYLSLNRSSGSLSGGESQRIRLATQIGSKLVNVLYILDEPSIGLHQRDNDRLIASLKQLRDVGNTVIVVEHDKDIMLESDYLIDMGPGAGRLGGEVVAEGTPQEFIKGDSTTAKYLRSELKIEVPKSRREGSGKSITIKGATGNNLKGVDVEFPLGKFICVTGVSGSGKSTLVNATLSPILFKKIYRSLEAPLPYSSVEGIDNVDKVIKVDQSPLGRTPRSNPATYCGLFTDVRNLYAMLPEAKIRGYKPARFSFNVKGGRCEECGGGGLKAIEMSFLPDVYVHCDKCQGLRYDRETLGVRYKGKSIGDVLNMTINMAMEFFQAVPQINRKLKALQDVGLGYVKLGQSSTTLSGGEAQRVKLASELSKKDTGRTLFILDEPTTGLHFEDIRVLLEVLNKIVDRGNTVLVIEHNMDIIKVADHIIDIGPEGGINGGTVVATGTPEEVQQSRESLTAPYLKDSLE